MEIKYDKEADAIYLKLKGHGVDHTVRIGPDIAVDYGPDGEIHGIEILSANEYINVGDPEPEITMRNLKAV